MPNYVPGTGNPNADIVFVGEAPGAAEDELCLPFIGPSGEIFNELLDGAEINRDHVWVTNVCKYRPPANDIKRLGEIGVDLAEQTNLLWTEIKQINPKLIVALGGTALKATTGLDKIQSRRGSVLPSVFGYPKVLASLHPANLLYMQGGEVSRYSAKAYMQLDFIRAKKQSAFKEIRYPTRNIWICRDAGQLYSYLKRNKDRPYVALDIESFKCIPICIALAFNRVEACSIQLLNYPTSHITPHQLANYWQMLAEFFESDIKKVGQNFKYDQTALERVLGFKVNSFFFDTMLGTHSINPEFPKALEFLTSIYTEEPYYKEEGKEFNYKKDSFDKLQMYNGKDAVVTYECFEEELKEMEEFGVTSFYFNFMHPLHDLYRGIEKEGFYVDREIQTEMERKYTAELAYTLDNLKVIAGHPVNVNAPQQVGDFLYRELKLPLRKDTQAKTLVALLNNHAKTDDQIRGITLVLSGRKISKQLSTYVRANTDYDGKHRTSYKITGAETGRTSTSVLKPPVRPHQCGLAFQTLTKHGEIGTEFRKMLKPEPGWVLLEADQSQAEARAVAVLSDDEDTLLLFDSTDIHKVTAGWVFECEPDQITKTQRVIGKITRHSGNYDAGKHEMMLNAAMQAQRFNIELQLSEWRAGQCLIKFHEKSPKIRGVFHKEIIDIMHTTRILVNPFGRKRMFFERLGNDLFKEAFAHLPQSIVSDQTKQAMVLCKREDPDMRIVVESHDAFMVMVRPNDLRATAKLMKDKLELPIDFSECTLKRDKKLIIPCELQAGDNWKEISAYDMAA